MNKFFATIFSFFLIILIIAFFVLLNTKLLINNPNKLKNIAEKGRLSDIVAFYIKDDIVKKNNIALNEGSNFEEVHATVNEESVTTMLNGAIDNLSIALKNPSSENLTFDLRLDNPDKPMYSFSKTVDLNNNPFFWLLSKSTLFLLAILVFMAVCVTGIIILPNRSVSKISFFAWSLIISAVLLASLYIFLNFSSLNYELLVQKSNFVREAKLINGIKRMIEIFIADQITIYFLESAVLLMAGSALLYIKKAFHLEKLEKISDKI